MTLTPEVAARDFNAARHDYEAVHGQGTNEHGCRRDGWSLAPLPMRRDPWASFRFVSFHEFAACCVVVLVIVVAILG